VDRRDFLKGAAAVPIVASIPAAAVAAIVTEVPLSKAWMVGTPGEYDWQAVWADTVGEARRIYGEERGTYTDGLCDDCESADCVCEHLSVRREPRWDGRGAVSSGDWIDVGYGAFCERCGNETGADDAYSIGGDAVCCDCMELADWKIADPERYAEMLEEELIEEYGM
jgi:hypothetical protein